MASLSDETCRALLNGDWDHDDLPLRVAKLSDSRCAVKTIEGIDPSQQHHPVFVLQIPDCEIDDAVEGGSFELAKNYYPKKRAVRVRRVADWKPLAHSQSPPCVSRSVLRHTCRRPGRVHEFSVYRIRKLRALENANRHFRVHSVTQRREWVELELEIPTLEIPNCPGIEKETLVLVEGVHSLLDGYQVMKRGPEGCTLVTPVTTLIFNSSKTVLSNARAEFVAEIAPDSVLYEIHPLKNGQAENLVSPSQLEWAEEPSHEARTPQNHVPNPSPLPPPASHQVPPQLLSASRQLPTPVATTSSYSRPSVGLDGGDVRAYLKRFCREDREMFDQTVLGSILRREDFFQLLHPLSTMFDTTALHDAFDYPYSHSLSAETVCEQSIDWHYSLSPHLPDAALPEVNGIIPEISLRSYQSQAVEQVMAPGNFLVRAATGSGKTRIFVEVARRTLMQDRGAKIFVVVPKRPLTTQHVREFNDHGFTQSGFPVAGYNSDSSASVKRILENSVIVMTAGKLKQHLEQSDITFHDIQLLIMDEAHNAKGNSCYAAIMERYHYLTDHDRGQSKILAVTATPAEGKQTGRIAMNLEKLLMTLHVPECNLVNIRDDHQEILHNAPQPEPETLTVESRTGDPDFRRFLCQFVGSCLKDYLPDHLISLGLSAVNEVRIPPYYGLLKDESTMSEFRQWQYNVASKLRSADLISAQRDDIEKTLAAICRMAEAAEQSRELGYESALEFLFTGLEQMHSENKDAMAECHINGSLLKRIYSAIHRCPYIEMLPSYISVSGADVVAMDCGAFPKFAKLVEILHTYKDVPNFHGIVFVRTRASAKKICQMLKASVLQSLMQFDYVVGQANRKSQTQILPQFDPGMSSSQLNSVFSWFKEDGQKVLVTTSVSEEGVNVVSCELVIRYSSAVTGTEFVQSRGRARKRGGRFVCIVEEDSRDAEYLQRCLRETHASHEVLMRRTTATHI